MVSLFRSCAVIPNSVIFRQSLIGGLRIISSQKSWCPRSYIGYKKFLNLLACILSNLSTKTNVSRLFIRSKLQNDSSSVKNEPTNLAFRQKCLRYVRLNSELKLTIRSCRSLHRQKNILCVKILHWRTVILTKSRGAKKKPYVYWYFRKRMDEKIVVRLLTLQIWKILV